MHYELLKLHREEIRQSIQNNRRSNQRSGFSLSPLKVLFAKKQPKCCECGCAVS
ncbi:hypothetical protein [Halobacillus sp. Marseille-Q1614]|uniref:hypothetical protein n=1 Tax=Halobacillus sp. Marseille-Q1614 TaxID=2709134 RepID=UPI00156D816F|nr:hypothetical protein [Halobacillus sp. Marseille-Q1614]